MRLVYGVMDILIIFWAVGLGFCILWLLIEGVPRWLESLIFPAKFIPKEERITVEDVASQSEWGKLGENSINREYNSGKETYLMEINENRNGNFVLIIRTGHIVIRRRYHRYKSIEKVVLAAYKMIVKHHNLSSSDASDLANRANAIFKEKRDGD